MSFRTRIALAGAAAVAVAVAAASAITYVVVRGELRSEIDEALRTRAVSTRLRIVEDPRSGRRFLDVPPPFLGGASGYLQLVTSDGRAIRPIGESVALPITDRDRDGGVGRGRRAVLLRCRRPGHTCARAHPPARAGLRAPDLAPARRGRRRTRPDPQLASRGRRRRHGHRRRAGVARRARRPRTGAPTHQDGRGGDGDARPLATDRGERS